MVASAVTVLDLSSRNGRKFLQRVAGGREDWRLVALPRNDWRISFIRDSAEIVTSSRVTIERPYREADSGDLPPVEVAGAWLLFGDAKTAASLLLDGWRFRIRHHAGSELSRELRQSVIEFVAVHPTGGSALAIGGVTVIDTEWNRTIIGGAVSAANRR